MSEVNIIDSLEFYVLVKSHSHLLIIYYISRKPKESLIKILQKLIGCLAKVENFTAKIKEKSEVLRLK